MPILKDCRLVRTSALTLLALACGLSANAQEPEAGVSHELAIGRAARISNVRYALNFKLQAHAETTAGGELLSFSDSGTGDLALDYRDGVINKATLNHKSMPIAMANGHLILPAAGLLNGENLVQLEFASNVAAAGKAITRYTDRDDQNEYIYTLFVPMDASMAFPCFDQPDLKGRFTLQVDAPSDWTVIANTAPSGHLSHGANTQTDFPETQPISTYLFAFTAGPWQKIAGTGGQPNLYVRKSQLARAKAEAPQVQQMTARGIKYLVDYFQQPFPFPKYDLVLIPGFPFGGMEHAGETFLNEDGVLFRTAPTQADYFRRNILVLHETTHQWFGDLVTMRWFDDLWLKEGFAQYMAYHALAELEPAQQPWKHFYEDIKPAAYGIDETQGTTPIFQNIANLKDAKSAYGAIVYQKAPSVLKQLEFFLGDTNFRDGLRLYLKQHAYANAQWADLVGAFAQTGGQTGNKDVQTWAKAWILQRGMPEVQVDRYSCKDRKLTSLSLRQSDVLKEGHLWPISNQIVLLSWISHIDPKTKIGTIRADQQTLKVSWKNADYLVTEAVGKPCPSVIFTNAGDYGYGRFLLDTLSAENVTTLLDPTSSPTPVSSLSSSISEGANPLLRSMLWGALWDNVHAAQSPPRRYVDLALKTLPTEEDETLARIQGGRITGALHNYISEKARKELAPRVETVIADRMLHAPTLNLRIVSFRTFTGVAETPSALGELKSLLDGSLAIEGMPLKPLDRWNLIGHLIAQNDPDAAALFAAEKARDHTGDGQKYAYAVEAGTPSAAVKARYFEEYLRSPSDAQARQEDWITQSLRPFNNWNQTAITEPYLTRALNELPEIKLHRKIFFLGAWLGAFIDGQNSATAQTTVHHWLDTTKLDPDLRLKVLEVSDALDRTVLIRSKFPE